MAFCPRCHKDMAQTDTVCPHCGYDFPTKSPGARQRTGLAYSGLATFALIVGQIVAGLGCVAAAIGSVMALVQNQLLYAFVVGPLVTLFLFALAVVFARTLDG